MSFQQYITKPSSNRDGNLPVNDRLIVSLLAQTQHGVGLHAVEIGTYLGETSNLLARALPDHLIVTVDIPAGATPHLPVDPRDSKYMIGQPVFDPEHSARIESIVVDSAFLKLPPMEIGFALIDGAHSYEYAKNDFFKVLPGCVEGAMIVFHDVGTFEGVAKAVFELMALTPGWRWLGRNDTSIVWTKVVFDHNWETLIKLI